MNNKCSISRSGRATSENTALVFMSEMKNQSKPETKMVVNGQLVEPAVCLSDLHDVSLLDIVRDTRQTLWTMIYRSQ